MLYQLPDRDIERFIEEDVPFGDLTTSLLGIGSLKGEITFSTRHSTALCCTEEAASVLEQCGATVTYCIESGSVVEAGVTILTATGPASSLHAGWKVAMNLLVYASGIATRTRTIVTRAREINPRISVVSTRKSFPGTKKLPSRQSWLAGLSPTGLAFRIQSLYSSSILYLWGGWTAFSKPLPN